MSRKITATLLALAMAAALFATALAEETDSAQEETGTTQSETGTAQDETASDSGTQSAEDGQSDAAEESSGETDGETPAAIEPDAVGTVSFANLDSRIRENNLTVLALEENIQAIQVIDYDEMQEDVRKSLNEIAKTQWTMITSMGTLGSFAASSLDSSYDALRETFDDLKDGKIQEDNAAVVRQLQNAQDQVVMAGESVYVALAEMELNRASLERQLTALDRTVEEMELRYELGQISALTLEQTKSGRESLVSGIETLDSNIKSYKTQLELMIGAELNGDIQLQALPQVSDAELEAMDLEEDLAAAKEASYELFAAQRTLDDAQEDYKDAGSDYGYNEKNYEFLSAKHTWQAAQYTYNATVQSYENSFRILYNQVKDYQQVLSAAETALACAEDTYAAEKLKYDQGNLSDNGLLDAQDDLSEAQDEVDSAEINLFSAYTNYRWAVEYGLLN